MNDKKIKVCITGSSGYLAKMLLSKLERDERVECVCGIDAAGQTFIPSRRENFYFHFQDPDLILKPDITNFFKLSRVTTLVHLAWTFDPPHNTARQFSVDVEASRNVFKAARAAGVKNIIYAGSTTAYGPVAREEFFISEYDTMELRGKECDYLYAKHKAIVDEEFRQFMLETPDVRCVLLRGAIVAGRNTRNIVSKMASLPVMFRVVGNDPPMQFVSEEDVAEVLYLATVENRISGVFNVAGDGPMLYSEIAKRLGKKCVSWPAGSLYPIVDMFWSMRMLPFPSPVLDLIRWPFCASNSKLKKEFGKCGGFKLKHTSKDAINMLAEGLRHRK